MSQGCLSPVACERDKDSRREFLSIKDYSKLNSLPSLTTIFRKPGSKSRVSNKGESEEEDSAVDVYVHCITTVTNAVAEEVRFNAQGKRFAVKQQNFLIPLEYDGWFEVLSQDGRSTRPIETVKELSSLEAQSSFLVRQSIKGYRQTGDRNYAVEVIREGTVLKTQEILQSSARQIAAADDSRGDAGELIKGPFLKCLDPHGGQIHLALDARGLFSPLACRSRIVGAHDIRSLLEKFRLPVLVRLIHGNISDGESSVEKAAPKIFRLLGKCSEEVAFVLLLNNNHSKMSGKDAFRMLSLPANEKYFLSPLKAMDSEEITCLQKNCAVRISNFKNAIRSSSSHKRHWLLPDKAIGSESIQQGHQLNNNNTVSDDTNGSHALSREEQQLFREIEDLYAAVRNPRHLQSIQTMRLQRQGPAEGAENATRFPKSFIKMAPFSNESFGGRPILFSRNLVFHGNLEKLNSKQTIGMRNELDKHSPAVDNNNLRFAKASNKDRDQMEGTNVQRPRETKSLSASKENIYEEIGSLRPCNDTAAKESQWTHATLNKHELELVQAPARGVGPEKTNKYTKVPRILNHHDNTGDDRQQKTHPHHQRNNVFVQNNSASAKNTHARDNSIGNWKDAKDEDHGITKATVFKDKIPYQKESFTDDQTTVMTWGQPRPALLRPKSYAGTPHSDHLLTAFLGPPTTTQPPAQSPAPPPSPPPQPPRRVASLTEVNVLSELQPMTVSSSSTPASNRLRPDQRRLSTSAAILPPLSRDVSATCGGGNFNRNLRTSKTLGNASRSLINNIRRMGNNNYRSTFDLSAAAKEFEHSGNSTTCFRPHQRLRICSTNDDVITTHV